MQKMFTKIKEGHDSKNRPVFVCQDENGQFVFKPSTSYASRHFTVGDAAIDAAFDHQVSCGHDGPWYMEGHAPAPYEVFPDFEAEWAKSGNAKPPKNKVNKAPAVTGPADKGTAKKTIPPVTGSAKKGTDKKASKKREG